MERKPARVVTLALANKTARIAWAVMTRGEIYCASPIAGGKKNNGSNTPPSRHARENVNDDDQTGPQPGHPEVLSGLQSSIV
jgi:hypothetical protein